MAQTIRIRPRRDGDLPHCVELLRAVHETDSYPLSWPARPAGWLSPSGLRRAWVAYAGGVVGHLALSDPDAVALEPFGSLVEGVEQVRAVSRLFVATWARGSGVGSALLAHATADARNTGHRLVLDVVADERGAASALYESAGWQRVATGAATWSTASGEHPLLHHYLGPVA